ncbi:MAG: hypothetical protein Q4C91_12460 [Eubacteriales bacterium]|nr:hypothetical protein [Eubacteriales bacterium]
MSKKHEEVMDMLKDRLSKALEVSMEELLLENQEYRSNFETFKSNVCHLVKDQGDLDFIIEVLQSKDIRRYWDRKWYPEAFYLLAMVDYLSRVNRYAKDLLLKALETPDLEALFLEQCEDETEAKAAILEIERKYPKVVREDNVSDIIQAALARKKQTRER